MDLTSYAWFIYILTFLLTIAIFFIILLILIKFIQTCLQTRLFCCKVPHRHHRNQASNRQECLSTELSSDSCSSSCSECEDYEVPVSNQGIDNFAFTNDFEITPGEKINRKYDDPSRYFAKQSQCQIKTISSTIEYPHLVIYPCLDTPGFYNSSDNQSVKSIDQDSYEIPPPYEQAVGESTV